MKTKILFIGVLVFVNFTTKSQFHIQWQKSLGGSNYDKAFSIVQTTDGGYIVAGESESNDGDAWSNPDYWIVKLDASGNIQWQKSLGGSDWDVAYSVVQTSDGGYIVAGESESTYGDVSGNHGSSDYWIVKLDANGNIEWEKSLGGSSDDRAYSIVQTSDGGFIVAGESSSNDGDVSGNHGRGDYWIVKLEASGNIQWQKSLGGSGSDFAEDIVQTSDGGYIVAGYSESNNDDVSGHHGFTDTTDYWIVKLDTSGNIQWQKSLGGSDEDYAFSIVQTGDGGYVVAGLSHSNNGDVSGNHGGYDYWIVKLDTSGNIQWQKSLGGSGWDMAYSIVQTGDGGYIVAGYSSSNDGDVSGNHGSSDYWVVKLDALGNIRWQKTLGGNNGDGAYSIVQTTDGGYIVAGYSWSNDGDVSGNHGFTDYWIVKFDYEEYADNVSLFEPVSVYPNPAKNKLIVEIKDNQTGIYTVSLVNVKGVTVYTTTTTSHKLEIDRRGLPSGIYSVVISGGNKVYTRKIVME